MNHLPDHGINDPDVHADTPAQASSCAPPCAEALLAGTLALMTGHAQACCAEHHQQMAARAASNLVLLAQHPLMSPGFQAVAWTLHTQWLQQMQAHQGGLAGPDRPALAAADDATATRHSRALWHITPEVIQ